MHRNDATGGAYVRSFAEAIQTYVDSNGYKPCALCRVDLRGRRRRGARPARRATPKSVEAVRSWNGSAWGACTADGIQRLDLKVTTTGDSVHRAEETLTVILRQPCNGATTAADDPCS